MSGAGGQALSKEMRRSGSRLRELEGCTGWALGLLPSSVSGKRVGSDDHLIPSPSNSGCSARGAASLPGGGLGVAALSLSPERKHLLSHPTQSAEPGCRASSGDHGGVLRGCQF